MGIRIRGPRLTEADVEELMRSHVKLVALDRTLKGTNWAGRDACIILAGDVDLVSARLYNKAEKAMNRPAGVESPAEPEHTPAERSADQDAAADGIAAPDKP